MLIQFTASMLQINPMVPNTRMGGNSLTGSPPVRVMMLNDTELDKATVGI